MAMDSSYIFTNEWCHGDTPATNAPLPPATNLLSDGRTSIAKGFPQETGEPIDEGGVPPARIDMNGVLRQITANLVWYGKGGMFDWVSTYVYSAPAIVRYATNGNYYKCIASSTVPAGTLPTNQTYWKRILDIDDIGELQDLYLPLTGGTLTGALTGTTGAFNYITCAGTASTSNIGFIGKSSTTATADKTQASISFKNVNNQTVSFNGSTGVDLTNGVYYAVTSGNASDMCGIFAYATYDSGALTNGWLICNGGTVSRTTYSRLFAKIGTKYGSGDGATTFNLPNMLDMVAWGATSSIGTYISAGLPNITGTCVGENRVGYWPGVNTGAFYDISETNNHAGVGDTDNDNIRTGFSASRSNPIYGNSSTVQPPARRLLPVVHA